MFQVSLTSSPKASAVEESDRPTVGRFTRVVRPRPLPVCRPRARTRSPPRRGDRARGSRPDELGEDASDLSWRYVDGVADVGPREFTAWASVLTSGRGVVPCLDDLPPRR